MWVKPHLQRRFYKHIATICDGGDEDGESNVLPAFYEEGNAVRGEISIFLFFCPSEKESMEYWSKWKWYFPEGIKVWLDAGRTWPRGVHV